MSSERPKSNPTDAAKELGEVDIGFASGVDEEKDHASEQVAERLGETWTPEAFETCKKLFDQIESLTRSRNRSWQPELNVALSKYFNLPLAQFERREIETEPVRHIWGQLQTSFSIFLRSNTKFEAGRRLREINPSNVHSPAEFYQILQGVLELLTKR